MTAEADLGQRQRSVRRYSRLVRWMKILFPVVALGLVGLIFLKGRDRGDVADLFTAEELARLGAGLRLEEPRFAGVADGGEPYIVSAEWAMPDSAMPERIELHRPKGEIDLGDGRELRGTSDTGVLRRSAETLDLVGNVVIETSDGYRATTDELTIGFGAKEAIAPGRIVAKWPDGEIEAGSFRAQGYDTGVSGTHIWFENGVRVLFIPPEDG